MGGLLVIYAFIEPAPYHNRDAHLKGGVPTRWNFHDVPRQFRLQVVAAHYEGGQAQSPGWRQLALEKLRCGFPAEPVCLMP
jgi:hypothetical protein